MMNYQREFDQVGPIEVDPEGPVTREKVAKAVEEHADLTLCLVAEDTMALSGPFDLKGEGPRYQCALLVQAPDQWVTFSVKKKEKEKKQPKELPLWKKLWIKYKKRRLQREVDKALEESSKWRRRLMQAEAAEACAKNDFNKAVEKRNEYYRKYPDL